ncbi:DUF6603 domain-containing protein [Cupriavidus sp. DF5525]|uniref:DUF6603 domain-containing protein n=1 Tax=Cupriavidus sp. DF5525 TaxID=3160989 RepID=UPI0003B0302D|nr:hypothetical protein N234_09795 [Ralstonia pickettii DTP0602]
MADALQNILTGAGLAIAPLREIDTPDKAVVFFRQLGYELPAGAFGSALSTLGTEATGLVAAVDTLANSTGEAGVAAAIVNLLGKLGTTIDAIRQLHVQVQAGGGAGVPDIGDLPRRLTDFLVLDYLHAQRPEAHGVFHLLGLIEHEPGAASGTPARLINWDRFGKFITEPGSIANEVYQWDTDFNVGKFLGRLEQIMRAAGLRGGFYGQADATRTALANTGADLAELRVPLLQKGLTPVTYSQFGITFSPAEPAGGKKRGIALLPYLMGTTSFDFGVCERGELVFDASGEIRGVGVVIRPPFNAEGMLNLTGAFSAALTIREKPAQAEELVLIGSRGGTRLSIEGLGIKWFIAGDAQQVDVGVEGQAQALRLVIAPGEGDGFLQKMLSGVNIQAEAGFGFGMSLQSGFTFHGGAKLGLELGTHLEMGPVKIEALRFALAPSASDVALEAGAVLKFELGPLQAVVENIGLRTVVRFAPGNIGPADLGVEFKPPNGVGLSLEAGGFKGGGYLMFDVDKGEYAGALELDFQGLFSAKAIGIINTKQPDGSPGFSLLIVIAAEFTPIQLSFGFTLNGVGGIIGLNRTIAVSALVEGVRTNAIKSILFPQDVVANINRIISDIRQFFPPLDDHFVVGPMAKLGWGTPSIITVELGLLLDLPNPMFAIVGVLRAVLPAEDAPILRLQVNFIGVLDFDRGYLFFRADLVDSRLLVYTITGSMALLVSWGEQKTFALSVGGFHPDFRDIPTIPALPDGLRNMARIGISLLSDDNPRLKVESYFAVTANTVQFGAKVELYAEAMGFNVYGFLGYDVLFQFEPFRFIARLYGGIALREDTSVIAGINITAQLSGPTPWDARGEASLTILFFDISVDFHVTWGDPAPAIGNQTEDLLERLQREIADTRNWRAELPANHHLHVSLRKIDEADSASLLVIHPMGVLTFSQRSFPLENYLIEKFGNKAPLNVNKFRLSNVNANGGDIPANFQDTREQFAPGEFSKLSDSDKLSRRSFEALPSGFSLTGTGDLVVPLPVRRDVSYELNYLHRKVVRLEFRGLVQIALRAYDRLVKGSAVRRSALAFQQTRPSMNAPEAVVLPEEDFALANVSDLKPHLAGAGGALIFKTQAEAAQRQQELIRSNPALAGQVQVVSRFELNS